MNFPMCRKAISILLILLFTVSILGCGANLDKTYSLSGQVVNHTGEGMGGVEITFGEQYDTVITDNNGFWEKDGLQDEVIVFPNCNKAVFAPVKKVFTMGEDNVNFILFNEMERGITSSSGTFVAHSKLSAGEEIEVTIVVNDEATGKPIEGIEAEINITGKTIELILQDVEGLYYPEVIILDMNNLEDYPDIEITRGSLFVKLKANLKPLAATAAITLKVVSLFSYTAGGIAVFTGVGTLPGLGAIALAVGVDVLSDLLMIYALQDDQGQVLASPTTVLIYESRASENYTELKIPAGSTLEDIDDAIQYVVGDRKYEVLIPEENPAGAYYNRDGSPKIISIYIIDDNNKFLDFGLEAIRPVPPVLLAPANVSKLNSTAVEFMWRPSAGATRYFIQIRRLHDQKVVYQQALGNVNSFQYDYFPKDGNIYDWRVCAGDLQGWGEPSDYFYFANGNIPPPRLIYPENNAQLSPGRINFNWEPVGGATAYGLLLRRQSDGQLILQKNLGNISSFSYAFPAVDEQYSWQIFAGNKIAGWGHASEARTFNVITGGGVPADASSITLLTPDNRSIIPGRDAVFEWAKTPGASAYYIYLQKIGDDAVTRQAVQRNTQYHYDRLEADGSKYRWMVEARVWLFWTRSSPVWEFINQAVETEKREKVLNVCDVWTAANSGGYGITIDRWDISELPAGTVFDIKFNTFKVPDKIIIEYEGATVYDSGWRGQQSYIDRNPDLYPGGLFGPGKDESRSIFIKRSENSFTITVYGPENNTKWNYQMRARCNK